MKLERTFSGFKKSDFFYVGWFNSSVYGFDCKGFSSDKGEDVGYWEIPDGNETFYI